MEQWHHHWYASADPGDPTSRVQIQTPGSLSIDYGRGVADYRGIEPGREGDSQSRPIGEPGEEMGELVGVNSEGDDGEGGDHDEEP